MTPEKIISIVEGIYEPRLQRMGVPKVRMDPKATFGSLDEGELLAHAHYLCETTKAYALVSLPRPGRPDI